MALRDEFPVLEKVAYLNAGTDGPIPRAATELVLKELKSALEDGRTWPHFERRMQLQTSARATRSSPPTTSIPACSGR
jgi:L-cysteine/cystine lyase